MNDYRQSPSAGNGALRRRDAGGGPTKPASGSGSAPRLGKVDPRVFGQLACDKDLSHGAFRLYHILLNHANRQEGKAWPQQRTIAKEMGCHLSSLKQWTLQLVRGQYIATSKAGQNHHCVYYLLHSLAKPGRYKRKLECRAPSLNTPARDAENRTAGRDGNCTDAGWKTGSRRVAGNRSGTKLSEPISRTKDGAGDPAAGSDPLMSGTVAAMREQLANAPDSPPRRQ